MLFEGVNLLAVLVAAAASFVFGSLWYSPLLFGKLWMKMSGVKSDKKDKFMWARFLFYFVATLIMSFVLAHILLLTGVGTLLDGVVTAVWLWLGFIATISLGGILWEKKSIGLYVLNNVYNILSLTLMALILVAWK